MSEMLPKQPDSDGSAPRPARADGFFDIISLTIIGAFTLAALVVVGVMYSGYRHTRNTAKADQFLEEKNHEAAKPYLQAVIDKYPGAWMRVRMLGDCYLMTGDPKTARDLYQRVLDDAGYQAALAAAQKPEEKAALALDEEMGICASKLGDEKTADAYFQQVLARAKDSPAANYYLGLRHFKEGRYAEAARCFQNTATESRWGDYWDRQADEYRRQIAQKVLGTEPAAKGKG